MGLELFAVKLKAQSESINPVSNAFVGNSIFRGTSQEIFGSTSSVVDMILSQNTAGLVLKTGFGKAWALSEFWTTKELI